MGRPVALRHRLYIVQFAGWTSRQLAPNPMKALAYGVDAVALSPDVKVKALHKSKAVLTAQVRECTPEETIEYFGRYADSYTVKPGSQVDKQMRGE